jgi:hypothetical protein
LPIVQSFHNTDYTPDLALAACFLSVTMVERWLKMALPERLQQLKKIGFCLFVLAGGWTLSRALTPQICRFFSTGIYSGALGNVGEGGFMGPERGSAMMGEKRPLRGWSPLPCVSVSLAAVTESNQVVASAPAELLSAGEGCSFFGVLPLPDGQQEVYIFAKTVLPDGSPKVIRGPRLTCYRRPDIPLALAAASIPIMAIFPWSGLVANAAMLGNWTHYQWKAWGGMDKSEFPHRLPGMQFLHSDSSLFRITSFKANFLEADYANLYGFSDIRNGGDNLDVLPIIYFNFLTNDLLSKPDASPEQTLGLRLLGLANVKYLMDVPESRRVSPALEEFYRGPDMVIYRNKLALPRAQFFDHYIELPVSDIRNWEQGKQMAFGILPSLFGQKDFDPQKVLVLHEAGRVELAAASSSEPLPSQASVDVVSYEPNRVVIKAQAPRPGYVFLADNAFPGWTATVNGKQAKILRAYLSFRAVAVPAGSSEIRFEYRPKPLLLASFVSCLMGLLWLGLFFWRGWEIKGPAAAEPGRVLSKNQKGRAPLVNEDSEKELWASRMTRGLILSMVLPLAFYWTAWSAFVYSGGIKRLGQGPWESSLAVNGIACCLLAYAAVRFFYALWRYRRAVRVPS